MLLYDNLINKVKTEFIHKYPHVHLERKSWPLTDENEIIFSNETAFELGGDNLPALAGNFITSSDLFCDNKIILIGDDLPLIKSNRPFARIALLKVIDSKLGENTNEIYQNLRKIDYVRYHVSPKGYMVRISPLSSKESVKVSKKAIEGGISFANIGDAYINAYLSRPEIKAATIVFITDPNFPYQKLEEVIKSEENITKTLDHLMNKVKMDCHSCSLQVVCNEVEQLIKQEK